MKNTAIFKHNMNLLHTHFTSSNIKMTALKFCILKLAVCCQKYTNLVSTGTWDGNCSYNKSQILLRED